MQQSLVVRKRTQNKIKDRDEAAKKYRKITKRKNKRKCERIK